MEKIHESLNPKEIAKPSNVVEAQVCEYSGMLATDTCPTTTAYFVEGTQPKAYCDAHTQADVINQRKHLCQQLHRLILQALCLQ